MALKYTNYVATPWAGPLVAKQIGLCQVSNTAPAVVMVDIDWSKYTSGFVQIDLLTQSPGQRIDVIKSVYVDNIGMVLPITVLFPDTQCEITCQANATGGQAVLTGNLQANIILGTTSISLSNLKAATTRIYFSNVDLHPYLNSQTPGAIAFYEASNSPGTAQAFIPKPAGELRGYWSYDIASSTFTDIQNNAVGSTANMLLNFSNIAAPLATSYIIITDLKVYTEQMYLSATTGGKSFNILTFAVGPGIGTANSYLTWQVPVGVDFYRYPYRLLQDSHNLFTQINPYSTNLVFSVSASIGGASIPSGTNGKFFLDMQFSYINKV